MLGLLPLFTVSYGNILVSKHAFFCLVLLHYFIKNVYPQNWFSKDTSGVQSSLYVYPYVSLSGCPRRFLVIMQVARNHVQCIQSQTKGSNPLSGCIICSYVYPYICPSVHMVVCMPFCNLCICINFQIRGPVCCDEFIVLLDFMVPSCEFIIMMSMLFSVFNALLEFYIT